MFVRYFVEVPYPFEVAEEALLRAPSEWAPGLARSADRKGTALLLEVGFDFDGNRRLEKEVEIDIGQPVRLESRTVLPMTWKATGAQGLFPMLEGDLEVAALGPNNTQLAVSAQYHPPLGIVGRVMDRALLHRIAEATVKDFVDRMAHTLHEMVSIQT